LEKKKGNDRFTITTCASKEERREKDGGRRERAIFIYRIGSGRKGEKKSKKKRKKRKKRGCLTIFFLHIQTRNSRERKNGRGEICEKKKGEGEGKGGEEA